MEVKKLTLGQKVMKFRYFLYRIRWWLWAILIVGFLVRLGIKFWG